MKDVNEFLASIELNRDMGTGPDDGHVSGFLPSGARPESAHAAAASCWRAVPGLQFREMPLADLCCGSAGIYNVVENEMAMAVLEKKMQSVNIDGRRR